MATKVSKKRSKGARTTAQVSALTKAVTTCFSARTVGQVVGQVRFGRVVVESTKPSAAQAKINIDAGRLALVRAKTVLIRPGVQVRVDPKIPLYHADPAMPGVLVRTLNGKTTRGRMVAGRFKSV
jgi:hypothetical protein